MDIQQLLAPEDASPLGRSRADVLDMLRAADGPLAIREVAQRLGLHQNTARFHLEALVEGALATRETEDRQTPGRPRIGYRAVADGPAGPRRYRLLAEMLTSLIAIMPEPGGAAEEAGREWGAYLAEQPPPYQRLNATDAIAKLTAIMTELGFAPQVVVGDRDGDYQLCLRQCPFREVAQQHKDVICALHLGLMRGALARMRARVSAERLDPFVEPSLCVARLAADNDSGAPKPAPGETRLTRIADARSPLVELRMQVDEALEPGGQPAQRHLVLAPALAELLDSPVSEVPGHLRRF